MGIQELEERLHKPEAESRRTGSSEFDPHLAGSSPNISMTSEWGVKKSNSFATYRKPLKIGLISIGAIALISISVAVFIRVRQSLFSGDRVTVTIVGPDNVNSSDLNHFKIQYRNENRSSLRDAEITLTYPPSFRPEGNDNSFRNDASSSTVFIGDIPSFGKGDFDFSGKFYGSRDSVAYLHATLRYRPRSLEAQFSSESQKSINLRTSSLAVEIDAPLTVSPRGEVNYVVSYENTSDSDLSNVRMKALYPSGFSFSEGAPRPSEGDAVWYLGLVPSGGKGSIRITGVLDGVPSESKTFHVDFGTFQGDNTFLAYSGSDRSTRIVAPPFSISQTINGSAPSSINPGDTVRYKVSFRNDSGIGLREVIVAVSLDGVALDYSRLRSEGGAYDSNRKEIIWKASDISSLATLAPNASGEVEFTVPVRGDLLPDSATSKNFSVKTIAKVESPDVQNPVGSNKIVSTNTAHVRVNSRVFLDSLAFYSDGEIPNTGPIPPAVGQNTTYTLHWLLSNTTNDVAGAEVSADLPTGVQWTGRTFPASETVSYNERTNKIVWNVGNLGVGEGFLSPKREVRFQVSIRPEVNQVGNEVVLLGTSTVHAKDVFTGDSLRSIARDKTTGVRNDDSVSSSGYRVIPSQ